MCGSREVWGRSRPFRSGYSLPLCGYEERDTKASYKHITGTGLLVFIWISFF